MTSFTPSRRPVRYVVGIDIGGTNIVAGTVAEDGSELLGLVSEPTFSEQGADAVLTRIVKLTRASMAAARGKEIAGVGIGSPGPHDTKTGVVLLTPNLGWTNFPLRDRLTQALGLPAALDNDANCAIFGEWWRGAARGADYVVGLTIGTGIGGGIVLGGQGYRGAADTAGEIGHITIASTAPPRQCGNYRCPPGYPAGPPSARGSAEVRRGAFKPGVEVCGIVPGELPGTAGVYGAAAVFIKHTWGKV